MVQPIQKTEIMKASELRIGNYTSLGMVRTIYADEFLVAGDGGMYLSSEADIHPLPLTEARLLKMGLEEGNRGYYLYGDITISVEGEVYFGDSDTWIASIYYVHQLQNLYFALEGEELTLTQS